MLRPILLTALAVVVLAAGVVCASPPRPAASQHQAILSAITEMNHIVTHRVRVSTMVDATTTGRWWQLRSKNHMVVEVHGDVLVGFDLKKVHVYVPPNEHLPIRVLLPAPTVLIARVDHGASQVHLRRRGWLRSSNDPELDALVWREAEAAISKIPHCVEKSQIRQTRALQGVLERAVARPIVITARVT